MPKQIKEQELEALKSKVKNPEIKKSIEDKQRYLNKPLSK